MGLQSFTSRKARQEKGKPLLSLSTIVSLLESALREERGLLQHKGSWEFGDSKLRHFKTLSLSAPSSMDEGYIYRGEEEVGIPTIVEGRPYPLGGSPIWWKQEAKGGRPWLFRRNHS